MMKRFFSILLAIVMISACTVTAFAESTQEEQPYKEEFLQYLEDNGLVNNLGTYRVVYSHYDESDEVPDWVLIVAYAEYLDSGSYGIFDDYILSSSNGEPYGLGYYFYDLNDDKFYLFHEAWEKGLIDMEELKASGKLPISILGDIDRDGELSILDATEIQLCLASIKELETDYFYRFAISKYGGRIKHIADRNCDGSVDILDATAIQMKLAGLDVQNNEELVYVEYDTVNYPDTYPEKPENSSALSFISKINSNSYFYNPSVDSFLAIVKTKEQYEDLFKGFSTAPDEEFFKTYWLVASMTHTNCDEEVAKITGVSVAGNTLYVSVAEYLPGGLEAVSPSEPPYVSLVAVSKDLLNSVTDIVRVK